MIMQQNVPSQTGRPSEFIYKIGPGLEFIRTFEPPFFFPIAPVHLHIAYGDD